MIFITSYKITNITCSYLCNCVRCGTCWYPCHNGYWNLLVNYDSDFNMTINGWPIATQMYSSNRDYKSVLDNLKSIPIGSILDCYYNSNNPTEVDWSQSESPLKYMILMIVFWTVTGIFLLTFVIAGGISMVSCCLRDNEAMKEKDSHKMKQISK